MSWAVPAAGGQGGRGSVGFLDEFINVQKFAGLVYLSAGAALFLVRPHPAAKPPTVLVGVVFSGGSHVFGEPGMFSGGSQGVLGGLTVRLGSPGCSRGAHRCRSRWQQVALAPTEAGGHGTRRKLGTSPGSPTDALQFCTSGTWRAQRRFAVNEHRLCNEGSPSRRIAPAHSTDLHGQLLWGQTKPEQHNKPLRSHSTVATL